MAKVKVILIIGAEAYPKGMMSDFDMVTLEYPDGMLLTDVTKDIVQKLKGGVEEVKQ